MGKILVTGGTGFIGSHTCVALTNAGYSVVVMDNLVNSKVESIARIEMITGKHIRFYRTDMLDEEGMRQIFEDNKIDAVIHFAGLKAVGESVQKPLEYYHNNISGTLSLLRVMREYGCRTMIFSSSGIRLQQPRALSGGYAHLCHQSLWLYQGDDRADAAGYLRGRPAVQCSSAAVLQPHRRS